MQCPGQDNRYWSGDAVFEIPCPHCGNMLEFFKDDSQRSCKQCGHRVLNPKIDFGCASYCPYAEQCLGSLPSELRSGGSLLKNRLADLVHKQLAGREEIYQLVSKRAEFGDLLSTAEGGRKAAIVAALLLSESEQPEKLLTELKAEENLSQEIQKLLTRQEAGNEEEAKGLAIFHDACLLAALAAGQPIPEPQPSWQTSTGAVEAEKLSYQ